MDGGALYGVSAEQIADLTRVNVRTARRWKADPAHIPAPAAKLLSILLGGELGEIDRAWRGWRLVRGRLVSDRDGMDFGPAEVRAAPFLERALRAAQDRNRFALQADWVAERYEAPGRLKRGGGT